MKKLLLISLISLCFFFSKAQNFIANAGVAYGCCGATIEVGAGGGVLPYVYNYEYEATTGANVWLPINSPNSPLDYTILTCGYFSQPTTCRVRVSDANGQMAYSGLFLVDPARFNDPTGNFQLNASINFSNNLALNAIRVSIDFSTGHGRAPFTYSYRENGTGNWIPFETSRFISADFTPADPCSNTTYEFKVNDYCGNFATNNSMGSGSLSFTPVVNGYTLSDATTCSTGKVQGIARGVGTLNYALEYIVADTADGTVPVTITATRTAYQSSPVFDNLPPDWYRVWVKDICGRENASSQFKLSGGYPQLDHQIYATVSNTDPCKLLVRLKPFKYFGQPYPETGLEPVQYGIQLHPDEQMRWQQSPEFIIPNGIYSFAMKDFCGRVSAWERRSMYIPHADISNSVMEDDICGKKITLTTTGVATGTILFGLSKNGSIAQGDTILQNTNVFHNVQPGSWQPFIQDGCGYINFQLDNYYDSNSHHIITVPSTPPVVVITVSPFNNIRPGESATFTATVKNGGAAPSFQWLKDGVEISGATGAVFVDINPTASVYTCRVTSFASCVSGSTVITNSNSIWLSVYQDMIAPCTPIQSAFNNNQYCIGFAGIGSIQNNTGCETNHYTAFTNLSTNCTIGSTQTIKLRKQGYTGNMKCNVYIDFNGDGDFDDPGELVVNNALVDWQSYYEATFTIPASASPGHHIIRVISDAPVYTINNPCATYTGEIEDYTINIPPLGTQCTPVIDQACGGNNWIQNVTIGTINNNSDCSNGYGDYSAAQLTEAIAGGTVSYSIRPGTYEGNAVVSIYIDYNKDGDFDDTGEKVADNQPLQFGTAVTGTFTLPASLATGSYRIRVVSENYYSGQTNPCHVTAGEVEDYALSVVPYLYCIPVVDISCSQLWMSNVSIANLANSSGCSAYTDYSHHLSATAAIGSTVHFSVNTASLYTPTGYVSIFIDYNNDGDFNDPGEMVKNVFMSYSLSDSFTLRPGIAPADYRMRILVDFYNDATHNPCHAGNGEIEDYTLHVTTTEPVYCIPGVSSPCGLWISNVTIGNINNSTDCSRSNEPLGYSDYSSTLKAKVSPGQTINFSINNQGSYNAGINIFVDYNSDGNFDGPGELVTPSILYSPAVGQAITGSFNIPAGLSNGNYRVRVVCDASNFSQIFPCFSTFGEAEDYTLSVAPPLSAEIYVSGNNITITDGDTSPDVADQTDFGNVEINTSASKTFVIQNTGNAPLHISGYGFSGANPTAFTVTTSPASPVAPGGSTSITLRFSPLSQLGVKNAILHINSDDVDNPNFRYAIKATAVCPLNGPEINLQGNGIDIISNDVLPDLSDNTDFGSVPLNTSVSKTFTIQNTGNSTLTLTDAYVQDYGSGQFVVINAPASSIAAGSSTTFTIQFTPVTTGSISDYMIIYNNDCDETYYAFPIAGTGVGACPVNTWTSAAGNGHWNDPANWCNGLAPTALTDAIIPAGITPYPALNTDGAIRSVELQVGASIDIGPNTLTINGAVTGTGTLSGSSASRLIIGGNAGVINFTSGAALLNNFTLKEFSSAVLGNSLAIDSGSVAGTVTLEGWAVLNTNNFLTLKSGLTGTASITELPVDAAGVALATINGDVTVERYIPKNNRQAWRLLSIPTNGTQTIHQSWQENQLPGINGMPGYGTNISGNMANATNSPTPGFDYQANAGSMRSFNYGTGTFEDVASTAAPITTNSGYFLFIHGDRSVTPSSPPSSVNATTLRTTGPLYTGDQSAITLGDVDKFRLIGNVYPSAIDFTLLEKTGGTASTFYLWDPKVYQGNIQGAYQTFSPLNGYQPTFPGASYTGSNTTIASGQAFFVYATVQPGSIKLKEGAKVAGSSSNVFRPASDPAQLKTSLLVNSIGNKYMADANTVVFDVAYSDSTDADDALKLPNMAENLAVSSNHKNLSMEGRQPVAASDTIFYEMWNMKQQAYQLEFAGNNLAGAVSSAKLEDGYLHTSTPINLAAPAPYNFTVDGNAASSMRSRLRIVLTGINSLPVTFTSISASQYNGGVRVQWKVAGERGIKKYEIERSADRRNFSGAGMVNATGNANNEVLYSWLDANAISGIHFYRIKSVGMDGEIKYSSIAKLAMGNAQQSISVSPNPVEGNTINLQFTNRAKGRYEMHLLSSVGQILINRYIDHAGGNATHIINLLSAVGRGSYHLEIIDPEKGRQVQTLLVR